MLFEKTYPGFLTKLKEQASDITLAEQRMAALTRLHLTTKQMAAVLGISPNSVIKAKQRLRQRFNFETDFQAEEFFYETLIIFCFPLLSFWHRLLPARPVRRGSPPFNLSTQAHNDPLGPCEQKA